MITLGEPPAQAAGRAQTPVRALVPGLDLTVARHLEVGVGQWPHARHAGACQDCCAHFDMGGVGTVVGPGETCLVCDDALVAGEVFVLGRWDGRVGPAHEDCPGVLDERLATNTGPDGDDESAGGLGRAALRRGGRTP